jgi:N,N'-diacetyllegionaminate synthase
MIIAEAGVNHNGELAKAKALIEVAAAAGADWVKFQTFKTEKNISRAAPKAEYQVRNTTEAESQYEMVKKLELSEADHAELQAHCQLHRIGFLSTGFDPESLDLLERMGVPFYKVPSGEITNIPYLRLIARRGKPVLLSTGMATLGEVESALQLLLEGGVAREQITVLHCTTEYPTPMQEVNLRAMQTMAQAFGVAVGYSDHTPGIEVPIAAVALGATVIEKHFTLDRNLPGPDHRASLEPQELVQMVQAIRNIELALGSPIKAPSPSEWPNRAIARKSIHLAGELAAGTALKEEHLIMKRPGDGLSSALIPLLLGRRLKADLPADTKLSLEDLQ